MSTWATWEAFKGGEVHCANCDDTGWQIVTRERRERGVLAAWMVKQLDPKIPRPLPTPSVAYKAGPVTSAQPCPCRATNPIYQLKRENEARRRGGTA